MVNDIVKDNIKLGTRLHTIASFVPEGSRLGDIGTDHAYLPVYLIQKGIIKSAVGVDIHKGPYESALETVTMYGVGQNIDIRQGNGLIPLRPDEIDTLVIAGMGGGTILEILQSQPKVLEEVSKIIIQPQGAEARVRKELISQGWRLKDECLVEEDNRIYSVIILTRSEGLGYQDIENRIKDIRGSFSNYAQQQNLDISTEVINDFINKYVWILGPIIIEDRDKHLQSIIRDNMINMENIIQEMRKTIREQVQTKSKLVEQESKLLEVMRRWLFQ
ncbi:MAG: tRNA methyltransferase [Gracilibacter sp. BRH_c7a]|nr:MAG: tRNA methyltransferase [Gracilibacter sp. BRH_c7a]